MDALRDDLNAALAECKELKTPKNKPGTTSDAIRRLRTLGREGGQMKQPTLNAAEDFCKRAQECAKECLEDGAAGELPRQLASIRKSNYSREVEKAEALVDATARWLNGWEAAMKEYHLNPNFRVSI
jgi:hypothetical protein